MGENKRGEKMRREKCGEGRHIETLTVDCSGKASVEIRL